MLTLFLQKKQRNIISDFDSTEHYKHPYMYLFVILQFIDGFLYFYTQKDSQAESRCIIS